MPRYSSVIGYRTTGGDYRRARYEVTAPDIATAATKAADKVRNDKRRRCAEVRDTETKLVITS